MENTNNPIEKALCNVAAVQVGLQEQQAILERVGSMLYKLGDHGLAAILRSSSNALDRQLHELMECEGWLYGTLTPKPRVSWRERSKIEAEQTA